jgi:uncharacterized protein
MRAIIDALRRVAVAFSAGVDSTLVLKVAADVLGRENVVAVTASSDSLAAADFADALDLSKLLDIPHEVIETDEFQKRAYTENPTNRCYHCKTTLYDHLASFIKVRGLDHVICGINADDLSDYRPGIQAAREHGVIAPAADAGLTKSDIRYLARALDLPVHDKPASPCLSSRVPYGQEVTPGKLRMIERAEELLKQQGFPVNRVRHHDLSHSDHPLARIEVPATDIARLTSYELFSRMSVEFQRLGYRSVEVDRRGFRSGSLNEVIQIGT